MNPEVVVPHRAGGAEENPEMKVYATFARQAPGDTWRLATISGLSAERARLLAEREQRRPGSEIREAGLSVREYESIEAVPWTLVATV